MGTDTSFTKGTKAKKPRVRLFCRVEAPGIEPDEKGGETVVSAVFPHVKREQDTRTTTPNYAKARDADDSRTIPGEGRARMLANLAADMQAALDAGNAERHAWQTKP